MSLCLVIAASSARADEPINLNIPLDSGISLGAALVWTFTETLVKGKLSPDDCRWCDGNGLDDSVRTALRWNDTTAAQRISDVAALLGPITVLAIDGATADTWRYFGEDALVMFEAVAVAMDFNQLAKFATGRQRPFVHFGMGGVPKDDHNLSFFSGHTTWTFAFAVSGATVAYMRGRKNAPLVLGIGLGMATLTGWMRIAGDKHYFTDVLVGATWGAGIGFVVPWFFHRRLPSVKLSAAPLPGGGYLGISGRF